MSVSSKITAKAALKGLRTAVKAKGADYVDPGSVRGGINGCVYFQADNPSCIVGHVLSYEGFGPQDVKAIEGFTSSLLNPTVSALDIPMTATAREILGRAQEVQDSGGNWGEALASAERLGDSLLLLDRVCLT